MSILTLIQNNQILSKSFIRYLLLKITPKRASFTILTVAIFTFLYKTHKRITTPPPQLAHLPYVNFYTYLKAAMTEMRVDQYARNVIGPLMNHTPGAFVQPAIGLGFWSVHLTDPIAIKQLLLRNEIYPKSTKNWGAPGSLLNRYMGGDSILSLNGDEWKRHRKIANRAFNQSMPIKLFSELTLEMFNTIERTGSTVNVIDLFQRLTIDVIGLASFGFNFNSLVDNGNEYISYYNSVKDGMLNPFFIIFHSFDTTYLHYFPKRQKIHDNLTAFLKLMDTIIEKKRKELNDQSNEYSLTDKSERDILTLMLESENDEDVALSNEELRNDLLIFFLAGHDTTAYTLAFIVYELALNQEIQEKARQEAIKILGNEKKDRLPTSEEIKKMDYITAVMKETMRMHTTVHNTTQREVTEDCFLGDIFIPKGTQVTAGIADVQRCASLWRNPDEFNPERFLPGGDHDQHTSEGISWLPFSAGGRICVGMNFSLAEQRVVLSMLLRKYTWKLAENSIHADALITKGLAFGMTSVKDLNIVFEKRY
ncbi:unnamed protein product [Cunninghamella blakesleeana]